MFGRQHVLLITLTKYVAHFRTRLILEPISAPNVIVTISIILLLPRLLIPITWRPLCFLVATSSILAVVLHLLRVICLLESVIRRGIHMLIRVRWGRSEVRLKVRIVHYEVVVLWHILLQAEMLSKE